MNDAIKVLGLYGSPRKGGNTELLLDEALKGAAEQGARAEGIRLCDFRITPCEECLSCFKDGVCVIDDDMKGIYLRLLEADVVILASPIFFYGITAWAKALVDRCQALWARKYVLHDPLLEGEKKRIGLFYLRGRDEGSADVRRGRPDGQVFLRRLQHEVCGGAPLQGCRCLRRYPEITRGAPTGLCRRCKARIGPKGRRRLSVGAEVTEQHDGSYRSRA